jgi:DNA transformation protein
MKVTPFLEYVLYDLFGDNPKVSARAMMGGYTLYMEGKVFAIVDDEILYLKGDKDTEGWYVEHSAKKFWYMKEGKKQFMNYFKIPEEVLENRDQFNEWVDVALSVAEKAKKK